MLNNNFIMNNYEYIRKWILLKKKGINLNFSMISLKEEYVLNELNQ